MKELQLNIFSMLVMACLSSSQLLAVHSSAFEDLSGWNFLDNELSGVEQDVGHGTHTGGIITHESLISTGLDSNDNVVILGGIMPSHSSISSIPFLGNIGGLPRQSPSQWVREWVRVREIIGLLDQPRMITSERVLTVEAVEDQSPENTLFADLWEQHVEAGVHQRNACQAMNENQFRKVEDEGCLEDNLSCAICMSNLADMLREAGKVVQVYCDGAPGHFFCQGCIEQNYQFQKICPVCRAVIMEKIDGK